MGANVLISSLHYVQQNAHLYPLIEETVLLKLPNESFEEFPLVSPFKETEYNPIADLKETISLLAPNMSSTVKETLKERVKAFNLLQNSGKSSFHPTKSRLRSLQRHILLQAYTRVIVRPNLLNKYKRFSNQVYGEATPEFASLMFSHCGLSTRCSFVDLGSGIGTVVLQAAIECGCDSFGIELMSLPSAYAKALQVETELRLKCYNLKYGKIRLKQGDFLNDAETFSRLEAATHIFTNNLVFGPKVNQSLLDLFICLPDGAKVCSLEPFDYNFSLSRETVHYPQAIFRTEKVEYPANSMSWTPSAGHFYIHTVDRKRICKYIE